MEKYIVITSISYPTEAVRLFSELSDYQLVVVGDKKTPADWTCPNTVFLAADSKETAGYALASRLPYNHYCRKMLGYLYAISQGAEFIVDTDDDNLPMENWTFPEFEGSFLQTPEGEGFINVYNYFTEQNIWPRGLPLSLINIRNRFDDLAVKPAKTGVWQGLADEDPDVDAVYRLVFDKPCNFDSKPPIVLGKGTVCPFNTQNTIIRKELFPLMYLPSYVTFRFTDILRGLVAQPIMWLYGYSLGFTEATVIQKRNPHDYFKDFVSEIPMYQQVEKVVAAVDGVIGERRSISDNLFEAYRALLAIGIVEERELETLEAWLKDVNK
ncbi:MAG: STELLO glycosyltransferase family protein [Dysgonamonadaceae bacterium]|nr:STELLO glycosyltransferase family protein [Dysgonamonadaceae bacterium]